LDQAPVTPRTGALFVIEMLAAISAWRQKRLMGQEGLVTASTCRDTLSRLAAGMGSKF